MAEAFEEGAREEPSWLSTRACQLVRRDLRLHLALLGSRADDGRASLASELLCELDPSSRSRRPVRRAMTEALLAFASVGARRACELAQDALELAREQVAMFEAAPEDPSPEERRELFAVLRDLDLSLLESAILPNLLALDRKPADAAASIPAVEELHDRLCHQFLAWEAAAVVPLGERPVHPTIRLRRLRALIHLLDVDAEEGADVGLRARVSRDRWLRASHTVLRRLVSDPPSVFRRSLAAALARALEGLVRAEVCDPVDALLFVAQHLAAPEHFTTLE